MLQKKDIEMIKRDIEVVNPDGKEEIKTALRTAEAWLKVPSQISKLRPADIERALSAHDAWNKSAILKKADPKQCVDAKRMHDKWQQSSILKKYSPAQIEESMAFMAEWSKISALKNMSPKKLPDAEALVKAWNHAPAFRGKTIRDLTQALEVVDAWKKSTTLKNKTPGQIEAAIAKVKHCKTATDAQKEKKQQEFAIMQEWKKSPALNKIVPKSLDALGKLVEEKKRNTLLNRSTPQQIGTALTMVEHRQKSSLLKKAGAQALCDAEAVSTEWRKVFSNAKVSDLAYATQIMAEWKKSSVLKQKTLDQIQKEWALAEGWYKLKDFKGKNPESVFTTVKVVEDFAKVISGSEYQKLAETEEQRFGGPTVDLPDAGSQRPVDLNLFDATNSMANDDYGYYKAFEKHIPLSQEFGRAFSVGAHIYYHDQFFIMNGKVLLTPFGLAEMIRKHPKYEEGQRVVLYICNAGFGALPFAQILATELDAIVHAADGLVKIDFETGEVSVKKGANWLIFEPENTSIRNAQREIYKRLLKRIREEGKEDVK